MPLFALKKHNLLLSNFYDVNNAENKNKSTKQNRGIFKKPNFVILPQVYQYLAGGDKTTTSNF